LGVQEDVRFMRMAIRQAQRGVGFTSPNPRVGAVIVKDGRVIARGYHRALGAPHAEVEALRRIPGGQARGATLYVTLEPCCHHGKTPPCTDAVIASGIKRVVYALQDPNPEVNGKGLELLRSAGVSVVGPLLEDEARSLNCGYLKYRRKQRPWVTLKWAQSLDGKIAAAGGDSRWISCPQSLQFAHRLRARHDAVLVGIGTVLRDDPELTVRRVRGRNPIRVILDSNLRVPREARLFAGDAPLWIAARKGIPADRMQGLAERGGVLLEIPEQASGMLDLDALLLELARRGILYLLVEGGARLLTSFVQTALFDEIIAIVAPELIGGDGLSCLQSLNVGNIEEAIPLHLKQHRVVGRDIICRYQRPDVE
jgi:diaminohydroxyphosphoribosylaminopyrimidine deaminase/5-amino-6-(5-phosphoribosylamino)uracil reductase